MKRLIWLFLLAAPLAYAQQHPVHCPRGSGTSCTTTAPADTTAVDPPWLIGGDVNTDFAQWFGLNGVAVGTNGSAPRIATYADIIALWNGCSGTQYLGYDGNCHSGGGAPGGSNGQVQVNSSGSFGGVSTTGSGNVVLATSPTLVTPALGTPSAAVLTNATGLPISTGVSGLGTSVATALAVNVGTAGSVVVNGGAAGTPSSLTLTNANGLPIAGLTGLGTGVGTALAVNVGTAGAPVVNGGALGTPSSGVATNLTGTASGLNIGGTAANLSGTPALPNGTTATTQTTGDNTTKLATDAFVLANAGSTSIANNTTLANNSGSTATATGLTPAQEIGVLNSASANAQTGTSYTPVLTDANISVTMSNASSNIVCVPPNSSVAYPVGTLLTVQEVSTGVTIIDPAGTGGCSGSGVTITSAAYGSSTTQTYSLGGVYGFIQLQQTATNTWNVVAWDTPVGQQIRALAISSEMQAYLAAHTAATMVATGCTPTSINNGPFAGKFNLASGPCTSIVITINGATGFTDPLGYDCSFDDETLQGAGTWFGKWGASADTTTTATMPIPGASGATDGISWACHPRSL